MKENSFNYKVIKKLVYKHYIHKGLKPYMADVYCKLIIKDFFESEVKFTKKIWAYSKGFISHRIVDYGITKENYKDYLSDYDYYKMYPLNGRESIWIDDKLTTKYVLAPFDKYLPEYYYMINKTRVTKLHNSTVSDPSIDDVIDLLDEKKILALKKEAAAGGDGFYRLTKKDNNYFANDTAYDKNKLKEFLSTLDNYLVCEYIVSHRDLRKYYDKSAGVLRIMVINEENPFIANAYYRCGSQKCGYIDAYHGSISSVVDIETGEYNEGFMHSGISFVPTNNHPDSQIPFEGVIPKWDFIKKKVLEIAEYMPQLNYMGFDICVTDNGFKIFEINSHQGIELFQITYPLLKNNLATEFFKKHIK